jgi:hypothetical protein
MLKNKFYGLVARKNCAYLLDNNCTLYYVLQEPMFNCNQSSWVQRHAMSAEFGFCSEI